MVTLQHCFWNTHMVLLLYFMFVSTGLCFVTFPRMGGVMAHTHVAKVCHKFQLHMEATSDHCLINTTGSHQHMLNFEVDF